MPPFRFSYNANRFASWKIKEFLSCLAVCWLEIVYLLPKLYNIA